MSNKIQVNKQSLIDWELKRDGKAIGWITKNYFKGNSGAYFFNVKAYGFIYGERVKEWDYTWTVIRKFSEAKNLIAEFNKD